MGCVLGGRGGRERKRGRDWGCKRAFPFSVQPEDMGTRELRTTSLTEPHICAPLAAEKPRRFREALSPDKYCAKVAHGKHHTHTAECHI